LVVSPRQAALGGKVLTIYDYDVNQANFNPASINPEMDNRLAVNYGSYYGEVRYGTASYGYTYDRHVQTFHAGVNYVNYGKFDGYDENGIATSSFTGSEIALSFGYAYNIPLPIFTLAPAQSSFRHRLKATALLAARSIWVVYLDEDNDINYALVVRNFGMQFKPYDGMREPLPFEIMAGISQELSNVPIRWHLTLENLQQWNVSFPIRRGRRTI
jgi:hypothetical protein